MKNIILNYILRIIKILGKTKWGEFEKNREIMKDIRKSFDTKTNYIILYLQVVLQNDKNILSILENL